METSSVIHELERSTLSRLSRGSVWYAIRDNFEKKEAFSCFQAVTVRDRLGSGENGGVPLWTELKSELGFACCTRSGREVPYAAHTRANTDLDKNCLAEQLGLSPQHTEWDIQLEDRAEEDTEAHRRQDSPYFGFVNPLNVEILFQLRREDINADSIHQVFDDSIFLDGGAPDTMTTNAGNRRRSLEIRSSDLVEVVKETFPHTSVGRIASPSEVWLTGGEHEKDYVWRFPPPYGPPIGILTGNSPESGLTLWNDIITLFRGAFQHTTDVSMPEVVVHSLPAMGISMELVKRKENVWGVMEPAIKNLLEAGCRLITVACNTTIYFADRIEKLCKPYGAEFVSIADACFPQITPSTSANSSVTREVGLVGIGPVVDLEGGLSGYARAFERLGIPVKTCDATRLGFLMKSIGVDPQLRMKAVKEFRNLMNRDFKDIDEVVLALTEVSLAYRQHRDTMKKGIKSTKNYIDPLWELTRFLVLKYIEKGFSGCRVCQITDEFNISSATRDRVYKIKEPF